MTITIQQQTCQRCGWQWYLRRPQLPKICPHCKHAGWQQAKKKKEETK